jgi:hypothetical protein
MLVMGCVSPVLELPAAVKLAALNQAPELSVKCFVHFISVIFVNLLLRRGPG